jgi:DNA invertase Pin-like site-specific DNA recombinase
VTESSPPPVLQQADDLADFIRTCGAKPRVWAYCRVSSAKQEGEGLSLDGQRAEVQAYCVKQGLAAPIIVEEVGSASKPMLAVALPGTTASGGFNPRPLFALLASALVSAPGSTLVVWKLDRFSRIGDEQEMLLRLLWNANTIVMSTQASETEVLKSGSNDPSRSLMRQIFASFAQYERAVIQLRMQMGLRAKAATGGWVCGTVPYGYTTKNADIVIDNEKAHVVRLIFYLRRFYGMSLREIGRALVHHGIKTPFDKMKVKRVLDGEKMYRGVYVDPFNGVHHRDDVRILPNDLEEWAKQVLTKTTPTIDQLQGDDHGYAG